MKKVILHIGSHKTGTSSIQSSIKNYNFKKIKAAVFPSINHSIPMYTIFSKNFLNYHVWKKKGYSNTQIIKKKKEFLNILNEQINDQTYDTLIISGEDISNLDQEDKILLINFFKNNKLDLEIVYFIRNPIDFCISSYQERIKGGLNEIKNHFQNFSSSNFNTVLPFLKNLSEDSVHIYSYDDSIKEYGDIVNAFSYYLNLSNLSNIRNNESLTEISLKIIYRLNNIPFKTLGNDKKFNARKKMRNELINYFTKNDYKQINKKIFTENLKINLKENEINLLKKYNFDTSFLNNKNHNIDNIIKYLNEFNIEDRIEFNKFCSQFILTDIIEKISLNSLILCLYLKFLYTDENDFINALRNEAISFEKKNFNFYKIYCYELMLMASYLRPKGVFIQKKLSKYNNHLKMKKV